jgi:hypothetical protein
MKRFIVTSLTSILLAASSAVMAQGIPIVDGNHEFGTTNGFGKHMFFTAASPQTFAFTVPAGMVGADIVFSDNPNTHDQTTKATLTTWTADAVPKVQTVNYSRVRVTTIPVTAGKRYFFTVNTSTTIAFAVMVRYRKASTVVTPPRGR